MATDLKDRRKLGLLPDSEFPAESEIRSKLNAAVSEFLAAHGFLDESETEVIPVAGAVLKWLAASRAGIVLLNLEDLWGETRPQNVPGTVSEFPNWRRKAGRRLDDFFKDGGIADLLREIDRFRKTASRKLLLSGKRGARGNDRTHRRPGPRSE